MKRISILFLVTFLLIAGILLTGCGEEEPVETTKPETPFEILLDAIDKTAASRTEEGSDIFERAQVGGSVAAKVTLPAGILPFTELNTAVYYGADKYAETISMKNGTSVLDLSLFLNGNTTVLSSSALSSAYGGTMQDVEELLSLITGGNAISGNVTGSPALVEALEGLMTNTMPLVEKYATVTPVLTEDDLTIKVEMTSANAALFIEEFIALAKADTAFVAAFAATVSSAAGEPMTFYSFLAEIDIDTLIADMKAEKATVTADIKATRSRVIQSCHLIVTETVDASDGTAPVTNELLSLKITLGTHGSLTLQLTAEEQNLYYDYDVTETDTTRKIMVSVGVTGVTLTPITYTYNKTSGAYTLSLAIPGTLSASLSGSVTETSDTWTLTVDSLDMSVTGDSLTGSLVPVSLPITASVTVKAVDTVPSAPASYKNFATLSEEELAEIVVELSENEIFSAIMEMLAEEEEPIEYPLPSGAYEGNNDYLIFDGNFVTHDKLSSTPSGYCTIDENGVITFDGEISLNGTLFYDVENDRLILITNTGEKIYTKLIEE